MQGEYLHHIKLICFISYGAAYFIISPTNLTTCQDSSAVFQCQISDNVPIYWLINDTDPIFLSIISPLTDALTHQSTLLIPISRLFSGSRIKCYYTLLPSGNTEYSSEVFLTVVGPSIAPSLTSFSVNITTSNISWSLPSEIQTRSVYSYSILLVINRNGMVVNNISTLHQSLIFSIPDPCDVYDVTVTAIYIYSGIRCIKNSSAPLSGAVPSAVMISNFSLLYPTDMHQLGNISLNIFFSFQPEVCSYMITATTSSHVFSFSSLKPLVFNRVSKIKIYLPANNVFNLTIFAINMYSFSASYITINSFDVVNVTIEVSNTTGLCEVMCTFNSGSNAQGCLVYLKHEATGELYCIQLYSNNTVMKETSQCHSVFLKSGMYHLNATDIEMNGNISATLAVTNVMRACNSLTTDKPTASADSAAAAAAAFGLVLIPTVCIVLYVLCWMKRCRIFKPGEYDNIVKYMIKPSNSSTTQPDSTPVNTCCEIKPSNSTTLYGAASKGHIAMVEKLLKAGADVNEDLGDGNTALHVAAERGHEGCVRLLLSTPGIIANPVNKRGLTPLKMATSYDILKMLEKYTTSCDDFPVHTYGKVIMCGDSGAGKSTLTEAVVHCSWSMSEGGVDQHRAKRMPVKTLTAGIVTHRVKSPKASMIVYDLAGHREYYSSHSSILELISKTTPSVFLLLVNLLLSIEQIIAQLYYWSAMIGNVCNKCPQQSSIIVVGTHADCLKDIKKIDLLRIQLPKIAMDAMKQLTFIQFTALNVTSFSEEIFHFMSLLHNIIDDVRMNCPAISLNCHVMYAFLNDKVPANQDAVSLSQLVTLLDQEYPKYLPTEVAEVSKLLTTLSEKGFIVFFDSNLADSWIVLRQNTLLEKVKGVLFAPADFDEHIPIASNTGVIPVSVLKSHFPQYNIDMITQFLIRVELCQPIVLGPHDTTHERPPRPDLFFPPLVRSRRPDDVTIPSDAFCWQMCTTSINQSFSPRFLHVLLTRIVDQFPLPTRDVCLDPDLQKYNRRRTVWIRGVSWMSEEGFTTVIDMSEDFRCLQCTVSTYDKNDNNYSMLVVSVCSVISKTCDEFCPTVSRVESIMCPPEATLDHVSATVECDVLKKILVNGTAQVIDFTRKRMVIISQWIEMEPQLNTFLGVHFKKDSLTASLTENDLMQIFQTTKSASGQWRAIGGNLGFTIDEMDSITREFGRHGDEDYYAAMLRRWLDWAPHNHTHPSLKSLQLALCAVGKERQANDL